MSKQRERRRPRAEAARPARSRRWGAPAFWFLLPALLLAGLASWRMRAPGGSPADDAAVRALTSDAAFDRALKLHRAGDLPGALVFYRRAIAAGGTSRSLHYSYAAALHSLVNSHRTTRGVPMPLVRSSDEAARLSREALAEYQLAAQLATDPRERANVLLRMGDLYRVWGLSWEAFAAYRQASALDPANELIAARGDALMLLLEHPERHVAGDDTEN